MLQALNALRSIYANRDVFWLIQQALTAFSKLDDGENKRKVAAEFLRAAQIKTELTAFDEAMKRIGKR